MRTGIVAFLAGNMTLLYWPYFPQIHTVIITAGVFLILTGVLYKSWNQKVFVRQTIFPFIILILGFTSGFLWTALYIELIETELDLGQLEGQTLRVNGQISSLPAQDSRKTRFLFTIVSRETGSAEHKTRDPAFKGKVSLSWYGSYPKLATGQYWQLDIRLKQNNGLMNPGGFDYEQWLFQNHVKATGYVLHGKPVSDRDSMPGLGAVRQMLAERLDEVLQNNPYKGLFKALALGERSAISAQQWQLLLRTGTNHLVAISGLHIGLIAGLSGLMVFFIWGHSSFINLKFPALKAASSAALLAAFFYAALAGFAIPTQRALIMLLVAYIAIMSGRHFKADHVLLWALLSVLLMDPLSSLSSGFWLSFMAVAVIIMMLSLRLYRVSHWLEKMAGFVKIQLVIFIGLLPSMAILFHQFSPVAPIANLVAVPLMSLLIVPASLAGAIISVFDTGLAVFIFNLLVIPLDALFWFLSQLSGLAFSLIYLPQFSLLILLLALSACLWLLMPKGWPGRWLAMVLLLPLFFIKAERPPPGELYLSILDVGQGLAMVVQTHRHLLVYDTGDNYSEHFNMADSVIIPFLRYRGLDKIDRLIVSHTDRDHSGSLKPLAMSLATRDIFSGEADSPLFTGYNVKQCQDGQHWYWDGVYFEILSPLIDEHKRQESTGKNNNYSCVLLITSASNTRFLLTGDIEKKVETQLLNQYPNLKVNVLQVPHHGSKTSSSIEFIKQLEPEIALFSYGYRNRFRHPSKQVVRRYRKNGVKIYTTVNGAIDIRRNLTNNSLSVEQYRLQNKRFWHREPEQL